MPYLCSLLDVTIGTQTWAACNLNVSEYSDGTSIPEVQDPTAWAALTTGAWCYYNNDSANGAIYGKLYNWYAVNDPKGLAPVGYHVPSQTEWSTLYTVLGGYDINGGAIKEAGTIHWLDPNTGATNNSGFTGLPGGNRNNNGVLFSGINSQAYWWSSTANNATTAWFRNIYFFTSDLNESFINKKCGLSVRCLKD